MSGIVGIPCCESGRSTAFWECVSCLDLPEDWVIKPQRGSSVARNRNLIIEYALTEKLDHVLFLDDDHVFPNWLLKTLLSHKLPIVSALYTKRLHPNYPLIFDVADPLNDDGAVRHHNLQKGEHGLIEVAATGAGALLIEGHVLKTLTEATAANQGSLKGCPFTLGQIEKDEWGDDLSFFKLCRESGYKIYVDLDMPIGHISEMSIFPMMNDEGHWINVANNNGLLMAMPKVVAVYKDGRL